MKYHLFEPNADDTIIIESSSNRGAMRAAGLRALAIGKAIDLLTETDGSYSDRYITTAIPDDNRKSYVFRRLL